MNCYACRMGWAHKLTPVHVVVLEPTDEDRMLVTNIHARKAERESAGGK